MYKIILTQKTKNMTDQILGYSIFFSKKDSSIEIWQTITEFDFNVNRQDHGREKQKKL